MLDWQFEKTLFTCTNMTIKRFICVESEFIKIVIVKNINNASDMPLEKHIVFTDRYMYKYSIDEIISDEMSQSL